VSRTKLFAESCADSDGKSTTLVLSLSLSLSFVHRRTRGRRNRNPWQRSISERSIPVKPIHPPSITVPNPARGCDLYVFHLRITYPCRSARSHPALLSALLHTVRPFPAHSTAPFRSISFPKPRRPVVSRLTASIIIQISRHGVSVASRHVHTNIFLSLMHPQLSYTRVYLVATSRICMIRHVYV